MDVAAADVALTAQEPQARNAGETNCKRQLLNDLLSHDPVQFSLDYQQSHQLIPPLQNALHFTDLRGIPRGTMMESIYNEFRNTLLNSIPTMDVSNRVKLLQASLSFLADANLCAIPLQLLETHPGDLPNEYYAEILPGLPQDFQDLLPVKVRRRCWELHPEVQFTQICTNFIDEYVKDARYVKTPNESFNLAVRRVREKIPTLDLLKSVLGDSKILLRSFQAQVLERMFAHSQSEQVQSVETLCGLYFDVLMVTGPADRSSLQDVPYLLEVIKNFELITGAFPVHPNTITEAQRMQLTRLDAAIQSLFREFVKHVAPGTRLGLVEPGAGAAAAAVSAPAAKFAAPTSSESLHKLVVELNKRVQRHHKQLHRLFHPRVVDVFPDLRVSYLECVRNRPMDLKTMLERKDYAGVGEILDDLQLIYKNCTTFNANNPVLCESAAKFLKVSTEYVHELHPAAAPAIAAGIQQQLPVAEVVVDAASTTAAPQEITQSCLDCFISIGDPIFARKLARLCWELLYFDSFNRGKLPRDVSSLRILAYFLSLSKNQALLHDICDAFANKTKLVLPRLEDDFVASFVTRDLVKFQMLLLIREQPDLDPSRVLSDSFLHPTCANVELYWRFLIDAQEDGAAAGAEERLLKLYDFLLETSPSVGMMRQLIRKMSHAQVQLAVMEQFFVKYHLASSNNNNPAAVTTASSGEGGEELRMFELAAQLFANSNSTSSNAVQKRWADCFSQLMRESAIARSVVFDMDSPVYSSKLSQRTRAALDKFLQRAEYQHLRNELNISANNTPLLLQRASSSRGGGDFE